MERLVELGYVRHIGTSNMTIPKLERLLSDAEIRPACNQMELHPHFQSPELFGFVRDAGIIPVGTTGSTVVTIPTPGTTAWLATRIVYADTSVNQTGTFTFPGGPAVMTPVSNHCGPVQAGGIVTSVNPPQMATT